MLSAQMAIPQEEDCPVPEHILGQLYRSSPHALDELIAAVPAQTRAVLALFCYRRAHLQSIGLAIATSCEAHDLEAFGGNAGKVLFEAARKAPEKAPRSLHPGRRKVTLSTGILKAVVQDEDDRVHGV
jgi:hypothetical protein